MRAWFEWFIFVENVQALDRTKKGINHLATTPYQITVKTRQEFVIAQFEEAEPIQLLNLARAPLELFSCPGLCKIGTLSLGAGGSSTN